MYFPVFHEDKNDGRGQISAVCARDVTFDGKQISVQENTTIMETAAQNGIHIPKLCYLKDINEIRGRAGIKLLTAGNLTLDKVRHERKVELAFEKHRYWDLKRWRLAHLDVSKGGLTNFRGTALCPYYNVKSGKYTFETGVPEKRKRLFLEKNYYTVFRAEDLSTNPLMVQNPGYGN